MACSTRGPAADRRPPRQPGRVGRPARVLDGPLDSGLLPGSQAPPTALGSRLQPHALDGGLLGGSGILGTAIGDGIIDNGLVP